MYYFEYKPNKVFHIFQWAAHFHPSHKTQIKIIFFVISLWGLSFSFHADASIGMFIFYYVCSDSALV